MYTEDFNGSTRNGTLGGTLLAIVLQINWPGLLNTALIAAVGAVTSFLVSVCLRYIGRRYFPPDADKED